MNKKRGTWRHVNRDKKETKVKMEEHSLAPLPKALAVAEKARIPPCTAHTFETEAEGVVAPRASTAPVLRVADSLAAPTSPEDACLKARRADIILITRER